MSYRLAFAGTPRFAVPALLALAKAADFEIVGVFSQPDRPAGRGKKPTASAVKSAAESLKLPIFQPEKLDIADLRPLLPLDALIVVAFGQILPESLLQTPRFGSLNLHASLLPRWRGAAPIARAILAGDAETGVAIMQMTAGLDTGPVFVQVPLPIQSDDTAESLEEKLAASGAELLLKTLPLIFTGKITAQAQALAGKSYAKKLQKSEAAISWEKNVLDIDRQVRAFYPYPIAESSFRGNTLRIFKGIPIPAEQTSGKAAEQLDEKLGQKLAEKSDEKNEKVTKKPGQILRVDKSGIQVACGAAGQAIYELQELQLAGGKRLKAWDFAQGQRQNLLGEILGQKAPKA